MKHRSVSSTEYEILVGHQYVWNHQVDQEIKMCLDFFSVFSVFSFFHRGYEKPVFRHWRKSVLCDYFSFQFPWWKKLYSYLGHHVFLSRIPFQPSGKALGLKSYPRKKKTASAVRNYYRWAIFKKRSFLSFIS